MNRTCLDLIGSTKGPLDDEQRTTLAFLSPVSRVNNKGEIKYNGRCAFPQNSKNVFDINGNTLVIPGDLYEEDRDQNSIYNLKRIDSKNYPSNGSVVLDDNFNLVSKDGYLKIFEDDIRAIKKLKRLKNSYITSNANYSRSNEYMVTYRNKINTDKEAVARTIEELKQQKQDLINKLNAMQFNFNSSDSSCLKSKYKAVIDGYNVKVDTYNQLVNQANSMNMAVFYAQPNFQGPSLKVAADTVVNDLTSGWNKNIDSFKLTTNTIVDLYGSFNLDPSGGAIQNYGLYSDMPYVFGQSNISKDNMLTNTSIRLPADFNNLFMSMRVKSEKSKLPAEKTKIDYFDFNFQGWNEGQFCEVPNQKNVVLYEECDFGGKSETKGEGKYDAKSLGFLMSSIKIPKGFVVTVYQNDNFTGQSVTFNSDVPCLLSFALENKKSWNDNVGSFVIKDTMPKQESQAPPVQRGSVPPQRESAPTNNNQTTTYTDKNLTIGFFDSMGGSIGTVNYEWSDNTTASVTLSSSFADIVALNNAVATIGNIANLSYLHSSWKQRTNIKTNAEITWGDGSVFKITENSGNTNGNGLTITLPNPKKKVQKIVLKRTG